LKGNRAAKLQRVVPKGTFPLVDIATVQAGFAGHDAGWTNQSLLADINTLRQIRRQRKTDTAREFYRPVTLLS
jgi:hypothetical protein